MFVIEKPFLPSLLFVDKVITYLIEEPLRCSSLEKAPGLAHKHQTKLERLAKNKHSSLLRKFVNYEEKKFYNIGPRKVLISWTQPSLQVQ